MRFAYIDSNGNEVPIPSVDALALRIELGAIREDTELYDAQADQWGPAHTHEIFHTLSRAAESGDEAFVAPLPPLPASAHTGSAPGPDAEPRRDSPEESDVLGDLDLADEAPETPAGRVADVSLAQPAKSAGSGAGELESAFDLRPAPEEEVPAEEDALILEVSPEPLIDESSAPGEAFDFGDLTAGSEVDTGFARAGGDEPMMDFSTESAADFGGGLEQDMEFDASGLGELADADAGGLELEQPMSEFSPDAPPEWMGPDEAEESGEEVMDFSSIVPDAPVTDAVGADVRRRRSPRDKPSPPRFKRQRSMVAPIVSVVALATIGVAGYVAWPIVSASLADRGGGGGGEVVLPPIPEALASQYRSATDAAFAAAFREARGSVAVPVPRTPGEWLAGRYLAGASQYEDVETFWIGVQDQLAAVRRIDGPTFREAFEAALASQGVSEADRATLSARADAGFAASVRGRAETLGMVDDIVTAALGLHGFLVANEQNIEYTPAAAITSDPVLEASPTTPEIRSSMEERIDQVTESLDRLDYLGDEVTLDGLWAQVLGRIQESGIR